MDAVAEELIWIESEDGLRLDGAVIRPTATPVKPVAVVHVHGFHGHFSEPTHILVARALARRGYLSVSGANRGSGFGAVGTRGSSSELVVTGAAWERLAECPHDIAPWISYAVGLGVPRVVLLGQSFGSAKVVYYQAHRQDPRVAGVILASPAPVHPLPLDPAVVAEARRMVAAGRGRDLLPWGALWDVTLSAQTLVAAATLEPHDIFGPGSAVPGVGQLQCPLLAFYGTVDEVGGPPDLEAIRRHAQAAPRVDLRVIEGADHAYTQREPEVGAVLADWLETLGAPA